jgi:hypothetical protein
LCHSIGVVDAVKVESLASLVVVVAAGSNTVTNVMSVLASDVMPG